MLRPRRGRLTKAAAAAAAFALLVVLGGCNPGRPLVDDDLVLLRWGHLEARQTGLLVGRLTFRGGCVGIESDQEQPWIVLWPPDTQLDRSTGVLRIVIDEVPYAEGDELQMGGGEADHQWATTLVGPVPPVCQRDQYTIAWT